MTSTARSHVKRVQWPGTRPLPLSDNNSDTRSSITDNNSDMPHPAPGNNSDTRPITAGNNSDRPHPDPDNNSEIQEGFKRKRGVLADY